MEFAPLAPGDGSAGALRSSITATAFIRSIKGSLQDRAAHAIPLIKPLPTEPGATAVEEVIIGDMTFEVLKMYLTASES